MVHSRVRLFVVVVVVFFYAPLLPVGLLEQKNQVQHVVFVVICGCCCFD